MSNPTAVSLPASTDTIPAAPPAELSPASARRLAVVFALTCLADFLFYGHPIGWTLGAMAACLIAAFAVSNRDLLSGPFARTILMAELGLCAAMIERPSALAVALFLFGLASFAVVGEPRLRAGVLVWAEGTLVWVFRAIKQPFIDAASGFDVMVRGAFAHQATSIVGLWLLPVVFATIFVLLFWDANPIVASWLEAVNWAALVSFWSAPRIALLVLVAAATWALIHPVIYKIVDWHADWRAVMVAETQQMRQDLAVGGLLDCIFSEGAIIRSMIVFNVLFAVQNALDGAYLWGGKALPAGFTFANYAHRGAYPLIATALLAAAFVLIAFRSGSTVKTSRGVRALMYLWIGQNLLLVASSIWRTTLYVEVYSLTYLRVAAFVWMGLVAVGLVLLIVRFAANKTNHWLLNGNALALGSVLYAACFVNFGAIIADYNVRHCAEVDGRSVRLDYLYLVQLGPDAAPAMKWIVAKAPNAPFELRPQIAIFEKQIQASVSTWRGWTFSRHRAVKAATS